jgi:hypothetical protein
MPRAATGGRALVGQAVANAGNGVRFAADRRFYN